MVARFALFFMLALASGVKLQAAVSRATADWVQANAARLDGQKHFLSVAYVSPGRVSGDFQNFYAWTYDNGRWGGIITVVVLTDEADKFFRRYGAHSQYMANGGLRTRSMSGIIVVDRNGSAFLDYTDGRFLHTIRRGVIETDPAESNPHIRIWTDTQGRTVEAEYLEHNSITVTFRRTEDGQVFTYRIDQLGQRDRAWLAAVQR